MSRLGDALTARLRHPLVVTIAPPHLRDPMSLERATAIAGIALLPVVFMALYNTGLQANLALAAGGGASVPGWRGAVIAVLSGGAAGPWKNIVHGVVYFLPVLAVAWAAGYVWQALFARLRRIDPAPGLSVTALVFALLMPPTVPLWQVALGMSFGVVMGREVFGGAGRTFLNPALVGAVFLVISYPADMGGGPVWVAVDGFAGTAPLAAATKGGLDALAAGGVTWTQAFLGWVPGSFGETSAPACLIGAAILIAAGQASWRVMVAVVLGAGAMGWAVAASVGSPIAALPFQWHMVLGGFAFGTVFIATDPSGGAITRPGRWAYGILVGALVILIRVANPGQAGGMLFAILMASICAPLIDYVVIRLNVRRREKRYARLR